MLRIIKGDTVRFCQMNYASWMYFFPSSQIHQKSRPCTVLMQRRIDPSSYPLQLLRIITITRTCVNAQDLSIVMQISVTLLQVVAHTSPTTNALILRSSISDIIIGISGPFTGFTQKKWTTTTISLFKNSLPIHKINSISFRIPSLQIAYHTAVEICVSY